MLAEISAQLLAAGGEDRVGWLKDRCGVYHLGGSGYASRLDWAKAILSLDPNKEEQIVECVEAASTEEFPSPARRPSFSALDCSKFERVFGLALPPWQEGVRLALEA
jgi:dTDP-4-dehydrorhamnose reductase